MSVQILNGDCRAVLKGLPDQSVHCCVTSPPYFGLRDYGHVGQIGLEATPDAYVSELVAVFAEVKRVLRDDGTLWLNLGDSYAGSGKGQTATGANDPKNNKTRGMVVDTHKPSNWNLKAKDLIGIPWRVAFALQADGWYLRQDIIWSKPNPMPESVQDRCTKAHEYIFMLSKSPRYFYDIEAIKEPMSMSSMERLSQDVEGQTGSDRVPFKTNGNMKAVGKIGKHGSTLQGGGHGRHYLGDAIPEKERREDKQRGHGRRHAGFNDRWDAMSKEEQGSGKRNKRSVWTVATKPFKEAHFATFPPDLIEPCILAGCPAGGVVLDPFGGAGTTGLVADRNGRNAILIELNPQYAEMSDDRIRADAGMFAETSP